MTNGADKSVSRDRIQSRAADGAFRKSLLSEAVNAYLSGDEPTGKTVLRDVINTTIGFEQLAADLQNPARASIGCSDHAAIPTPPTSSRFSECSRGESV